ncbi:hypothetical protein C8Q70DRAFT_344388 [Cubamyces menziesii]|nr:hypothetical protein C8Q70DRAFT_344388 [Cubamyces menziesii]
MPLDSFRLLSSEPHISLTAFNSPDQVPGGYAVVSHVWRATEPSLREVQQLADQEATYDDSRLDDKIRQCCILTRARGLPYFWIDSPCIDQRNSTELSEAISSMYACSAFRRSVYFTRSWTLQELIAPKRVVFVSSDWTVLGEKQDLAELLEEITNIDRQILTFCRPLTDVSIACKLSWAARRNARRIEDRAYSLLGLFDIHMPMMYGEGEKAFARLLHTILKEKCDHTALAWGRATDLPLSHPPSLTPLLRGCDPKPVSQQATPVCPPSPAAFVDSAHLTPVDIEEFMSTMATWGASPTGDNKSLRLPYFTFGQHGLECYLPVICDGAGVTPVAAVLACRDHTGSFVALALHPRGSFHLRYGIGAMGGLHGPALEEDPPRLFRIPASGPNAGLRGFNGGLLFWRRRRTYTINLVWQKLSTHPSARRSRISKHHPDINASFSPIATSACLGLSTPIEAPCREPLCGSVRRWTSGAVEYGAGRSLPVQTNRPTLKSLKRLLVPVGGRTSSKKIPISN